MVLNSPESLSQAVQEQNTSIMSLKYGTAYLNIFKESFQNHLWFHNISEVYLFQNK